MLQKLPPHFFSRRTTTRCWMHRWNTNPIEMPTRKRGEHRRPPQKPLSELYSCLRIAPSGLLRTYVSARWPGRENDKRVLHNSTLYAAFEQGWRPFPGAVLLGDSGYSMK